MVLFLQKCFSGRKVFIVITEKWQHDNLIRFRLRVSGLRNCKRWFLKEESSEDTICPSCENSVENEVHFLFLCTAYTDKRNECRVIDFRKEHPDINDVANLLSNTSGSVIKYLAKFIAEAMKIRKKQIERKRI